MIIGAMKCGTSSLYNYLCQHPEICPARTKEPEYFAARHMHDRQASDYADLWAFDPAVHRYALEASTSYTKHPAKPDVPKRIHEAGLRPRFIYIVRDPFDRIASHYNYMQNKRPERLSMLDPHAIETSNYFLQLEQYRPYFSRNDIVILDFDQLAHDPAQLVRTTHRFLGLSEDHLPKEYEVRNSTRIRSELERKLMGSKVRAVRRYLPSAVVRAGTELLRSAPARPKRVLSESEREFIHRALYRDMIRLQESYGIDVGRWGFHT